MRTHDPLCGLMVQETCSGIGGMNWCHDLDLDRCRNCGKHCTCDIIRNVRNDDSVIGAVRAKLDDAQRLIDSVGRCSQCGQSWLEEPCGPTHAATWWIATHPVEAYNETMRLREEAER